MVSTIRATFRADAKQEGQADQSSAGNDRTKDSIEIRRDLALPA